MLTAAGVALAVGTGAVFGPLSSPAQAQQAIQVGVDRVTTQSQHQTLPVLGRFVAKRAGVVAARIGGPVHEFKVTVGDRVKQGDVIAVLDKGRLKWERELMRSEVKRYTQAIKTAQQTRRVAEVEKERQEELKRLDLVANSRLHEERARVAVADSQIAEARNQLVTAKANLQLAEISMKDATVRAPYNGVITQRHTEIGSFVSVGEAIVTMIDDKNLELDVDVPARNISGLTPGTVVPVVLTNGKRLKAKVRAVVPDENPQTRTRSVRLTPIKNGPVGELVPNQSATLEIPTSAGGKVLTVHKDAVLNQQGKTLVYVVADGKANIRPVSLGDAVGSRFIVLNGLKDGDVAVIRGNERLRPGQEVTHAALPPRSDAAQARPKSATKATRG